MAAGKIYLGSDLIYDATVGGDPAPTNLVELAVADHAATILPFTDTSGTAVTDSAPAPYARAGSTYGAGVTLNQTPPGDLTGAVDLAGSNLNQNVLVSSYVNTNLSNYLDPFSVELVARIDGAGSVGDTTLATLFGINGTHRFLVGTATGALTVQSGSGVTAGNGTFPIGSWFHMVFTYNPAGSPKAALWVNNAAKTLTGASTAQVISSITARLGSYNGSNYLLNGGLAFFALYWHTLDATQVADHYAMSGL